MAMCYKSNYEQLMYIIISRKKESFTFLDLVLIIAFNYETHLVIAVSSDY